MKINTPKSSKKKNIIIAIVVTILCVGYLVFAYNASIIPFSSSESAFEVDKDGRGVNYNKTNTESHEENEVTNNPDRKTEAVNTDSPTAPVAMDDTEKSLVTVMVTNTGQSVDYSTVDASGFVTNVTESGGSCTYEFTNGIKTVEKTVDTLPNPSSTTCKSIKFSSSELDKGEWSVFLKYDSQLYTGVSDSMKLIVE